MTAILILVLANLLATLICLGMLIINRKERL